MDYNLDLVRMLLWVVGVLVSALAFFLSYYFYRTSRILDSLNEGVQKLNINFTGLNCSKKHEVIDKRLDDHGVRLDKHEGKLIEIDTKINFR